MSDNLLIVSFANTPMADFLSVAHLQNTLTQHVKLPLQRLVHELIKTKESRASPVSWSEAPWPPAEAGSAALHRKRWHHWTWRPRHTPRLLRLCLYSDCCPWLWPWPHKGPGTRLCPGSWCFLAQSDSVRFPCSRSRQDLQLCRWSTWARLWRRQHSETEYSPWTEFYRCLWVRPPSCCCCFAGVLSGVSGGGVASARDSQTPTHYHLSRQHPASRWSENFRTWRPKGDGCQKMCLGQITNQKPYSKLY